jgi:hypothetical protein
MDPFHTEENVDDKLNDSLSEAESEDASLADEDEMALALIQEYRQQSSRKENPLQAVLATVNCGLMELAHHSGKALKNACRSAGGDFLATSHGQRAMNHHLSLTRQVRCYGDLDMRLEEAKKQEENAQAQRRMAAMQAPGGTRYPMR